MIREDGGRGRPSAFVTTLDENVHSSAEVDNVSVS